MKLGFYNILNCKGFVAEHVGTGMDFGPCFQAKIWAVILFFIVAMVRKWGGEEMNIEFNFWWAIGLAEGLYLVAITFTGSWKLAMIAGIIGMVVGGYGMGMFGGGGEGY